MTKCNQKQLHLFAIIFFFIVASGILSFKIVLPKFNITKQESAYNFRSKTMIVLSLGNRRLFASLLWVLTMIEADIDHYKKKDTNSWMYHRFDSITDLNPFFYTAYRTGGIYLSIIKDDDLGANEFFNKGIKQYPFDIDLNYYHGYHCLIELADHECALKRYTTVIENEAGFKRYKMNLPSLVMKLKLKLNPDQDVEKAVHEMKNQFQDDQELQKRFDIILEKYKKKNE